MRWILGLVVAAALGAGLWLVLGHDADPAGHDEIADGRAADGTHRGPELRGSGAGGSGRELSAFKGRSTLDVDVRREGRGVVATVELRRVGGMEVADPSRSGRFGWTNVLFVLPEPERAPLLTATSDAQGRARLTGLAPGVYRINARDDAGNEGSANTALPQDGARGAVTLDLVPATLVLEARISWSDGKPLSGTLVLTPMPDARGVWMWVPPQGDLPRALIQPDGSARVERLHAGTYDVRVVMSETLTVSGPRVVLPAKAPYVFVVDAGEQRVAGRVVDGVSGSPVAGATLTLASALDDRRSFVTARATSDDGGRFAFTIPRVPAFLSVEAAGYASARREVAAATADLTVSLVKSARVSGRVTGPDGAAAAGAVVHAASAGWNSPGRTATADKDGRYALEDTSTGDVQVVVKGGGWVSPGLGDVQSGGFNPFVQRLPAGGSVTLDLSAVRAAQIAGKVFDASGAPVAGATVSTQITSRPNFGYPTNYGDFALPGQRDLDSAATDDTGAFLLADLVPGSSYTLHADAPGQARATAGPFVVAGDATTQAELRFAVPRFVDVLLLYEGDEKPVVGARVMATAQSGSSAWPPRGTQSGSALTDPEGRARTGPVGDGLLSVIVTGTMVVVPRNAQNVEGSESGPGPFSITLRLPRGLAIEGLVLKPDGTPAAGADIEVEGDRMSRFEDVTSGADGTFTMSGLGAGSRTLSASLRLPDRTRLRGQATAEAGGTGVTITLGTGEDKSRATYRFHVLDEQGQPVLSGNARLTSQGSSAGTNISEGWATLETDVGPSSFVARGLKQGDLFAEVTEARGPDGLRLPTGPGRVGPLTADQREIEIRLPPERTITGRVLASDGAKLPGVLVRASLPEERGGRTAVSEGRSDASGAFKIGGLGDGEYRLEASASPDYVPTTPQTASAGATGVELVVRRGTSVRVRVTDYAGKAVSGAYAYLEPTPKPQASVPGAPGAPGAQFQGRGGRGETQLGTSTAMDGTALFRGLDGETTYTLQVNLPTSGRGEGTSSRDDLRPFRQERWTPADTDVRMERGYVVAGVVRDTEGRPVPGASVRRKRDEKGWATERVGSDGTFRIRGLDAGPVTLRATGPGRRMMPEAPKEVPEVTVQAGTENVVLVVDAGLTLTVRVANASERREGRVRVNLLNWRNERWSRQESETDRDGLGKVTFYGLQAGERYAVSIAPEGDDLYAWQPDVRPGEVTVRLERGGKISGRLTFPSELRASVSASNEIGLSASGTVDADGRYEIKGLPDGRWKVRAHAMPEAGGGAKALQAEGETNVGGTLDLTLRAP